MMMVVVIDQVHLLKRGWVGVVEQLNCYTGSRDLQCWDGYTAGEEGERKLGELENVVTAAVVDAEGVDGNMLMGCKAD